MTNNFYQRPLQETPLEETSTVDLFFGPMRETSMCHLFQIPLIELRPLLVTTTIELSPRDLSLSHLYQRSLLQTSARDFCLTPSTRHLYLRPLFERFKQWTYSRDLSMLEGDFFRRPLLEQSKADLYQRPLLETSCRRPLQATSTGDLYQRTTLLQTSQDDYTGDLPLQDTSAGDLYVGRRVEALKHRSIKDPKG